MKNKNLLFAALAVFVCSTTFAHASLKLAGVFSDNMVLQRDTHVPVWGWAKSGQKITVEFAGQSQSTMADQSGKWMVKLSPMTTSFDSRTLLVMADDSRLQITNVLVGEVWLAGGQSNMGVSLGEAWYAREEAAHANDPDFRYLAIIVAGADEPQLDVPVNRQTGQPARWEICSSNSAPHFSGVCYFFGRELQKELQVPVGILRSSRGATPVEAWTSRGAFQQTEAGRECFAEWQNKFADPAADHARYLKMVNDAASAAKAEGKSAPWFPAYEEPAKSSQRPSNFYNAMIAPLAPFAFRGVIWYQGENNANPLKRAEAYSELFPELIRDWRNLWHRQFPFLFVQLPSYRDYGTNRLNWPALRESQAATLSLPYTGMAVAIDVGTPNNIHPPDKKPVAHRLVLQELKIAYRRRIVADGPIYSSAKFKDHQAVISFRNVGAGLVSRSGNSLKGFAIAGVDKTFIPAQARLAGNQVVVWSKRVSHPTAVRYAFINALETSLYGQDGLPVPPFRTDDWPLVDPPDE